MNCKTTIHKDRPISQMSVLVSEEYAHLITPQQKKVLSHNVFSIGEDPLVSHYSGCGAGWCEISKKGKLVDFKYFSETEALIKGVQSEKTKSISDWYCSDGEIHRDRLMSSGQTNQNFYMFFFTPDDLRPRLLDNGNMRMIVNFSCFSLIRF